MLNIKGLAAGACRFKLNRRNRNLGHQLPGSEEATRLEIMEREKLRKNFGKHLYFKGMRKEFVADSETEDEIAYFPRMSRSETDYYQWMIRKKWR